MAGACISGPECVKASVVCICYGLGFGIGKGGLVRRASRLADRTSRVEWCTLCVCGVTCVCRRMDLSWIFSFVSG